MTGLRGTAAIVGIGLAGIPRMPPGSTPTDCIGLAASAALADAGILPEEVDGVFASGLQMLMPALGLTEYLRLAPRYIDGTQVGGCAPLVQLNHARAAIAAGLCSVALIAYGSTQASSGAAFASLSEPQVFEADLGWPGPVAAYALIAQRHMHEFGTRRQDLAEVAVAARRWAQLTPGATAQAPLTLDDVLASRMVASPLTARDCCLVTDGGGALVVVSSQRARSMRQAVYVLAGAEHASHRSIAQMPDLTTTGAAVTGPRAFVEAGLSPSDVDVLQLYDAFTINPIVFLEDLGFCAKGEGGAFVRDGALAPGGRLPVNTNGGGLSFCHPGMYGIFTLIESVLQLRGGLGARQVPGAEVALAHAPGGFMASQATILLGGPSTV
jgi:acetyl-CoA acetyltransferase